MQLVFQDVPQDVEVERTLKSIKIFDFISKWDYLPSSKCIAETFKTTVPTAGRAVKMLMQLRGIYFNPNSKEILNKRFERSCFIRFINIINGHKRAFPELRLLTK